MLSLIAGVRAAAGSWRLWLVLVIVTAFIAMAGQLYSRGNAIQAITAEKAVLATRLESVGALLSDQNIAVQSLRKASDAQAQRAANAARSAERALGAANARAEALALVQVPTACPDALEWLREELSKSARTREAAR